MTDHESQPVLTRQLAAECDMLLLRSAAHERTEAELRREIDDLREQVKMHKQSLAYNRVTIENLKESLRLVGQLRMAEGHA